MKKEVDSNKQLEYSELNATFEAATTWQPADGIQIVQQPTSFLEKVEAAA
jgi:hypothetical protein